MDTDKTLSDAPALRPTRGKISLLFILTLISACFGALFAGSFADVIFISLSVGLCAAALVYSGSFLPVLAALPAYVLALVLSRDFVGALASIEFVPASLVILRAYKKGRDLVSATCRAAAALAAFELLMFSVTALSLYGGIGVLQIRTLIENVHTEFTDALFGALSSIPQTSVAISYETVSESVAYFLMLTPGIFITLYTAAAFFSLRIALFTLKRLGAKELIYEEMREYRISRTAALVYIVAYLVSVFFSGKKVNTTSAVLENLVIILTPGLALYGIKDFVKRRKERPSTFPVFFILMMILLLFTTPSLFFGILCFMGAWAAFRKN